MKLRRIGVVPGFAPSDFLGLDLGVEPRLLWVDPKTLLVDEAYQREMNTVRSQRLLIKLVKQFAWNRYKPPIVVETPDGLHCIDGQHTATAAATRKLDKIPVFLVVADSQAARAESFVAHNKDRVELTSFALYRARLAAGDEVALDTQNVCTRSGVKLVQAISYNARIDVGVTSCVAKIQGLIKRQGVHQSRRVLEALVQGGCAPISAVHIDAVEAVMCLLRPLTTIDEMAKVIRALTDFGLAECQLEAKRIEKPVKHVLFNRYIDLLEKQTGIVRALAS